jgi:hypothetical protein
MKQPENATLVISIKGLADGKYPVELSSAHVQQIEHIFPECTGMLTVRGSIRKHGKRFLLELVAEIQARFLCDVSGEEFEDIVVAEFSLEYIADTHLALLKADEEDREPPYYIRDDDTNIDITDEVRQELAVRLPLKRISPKYRDREFTDIFPSHADSASAVTAPTPDDRWAALKNISFDKSKNQYTDKQLPLFSRDFLGHDNAKSKTQTLEIAQRKTPHALQSNPINTR